MHLADPDRHHFIVEIRLENPQSRQALMLPSWIPGSYLLREFARHVVAIGARDAAGPVRIEQTAKGSWVAEGARGELRVELTVHAYDLSVRGAYFDRSRAFFNGTSLLLLPEGRDQEPLALTIERPGHTDRWRVTTAMTADATDAAGFGRYRAENYDELIDHPFEIGGHAVVDFEAAGVAHRLAVSGRFAADLDRVATDLAQLCTTQIDFFGRPPPFGAYTFLGHAVGDGFGGLEHRASSSLIFRRSDLPKPGEAGVPRDYQRFLALCSHEYFHSWHIKRTKPAAFVPYRLERRNHTRLLWVFEGITSYYQERMLLYSGLLGQAAHLRRLSELLTRVYRVPGRHHQTLEQSSFNAWDRLYKPQANSVNQDVSYYSKGALVALALDLTIRSAGVEGATLDTIVVELWRRYGRPGIGVPEDGFETLAVEIGGEAIRGFLEIATRSTADLDLAALFREFGLTLGLRQAEGPTDAGGAPAQRRGSRLTLGAGYEPCPSGLKLATVIEGLPAEAAGLAPGDIIVSLDRLRTTRETIGEQLERYEEGDEVDVSFFRDDVLGETRLCLAAAPLDTCYLEIDEAAAPEAVRRRLAWLGEPTG